MTYRVGNHQPQNVYRDDAYIGVMFTAEDAALAVEALNGTAGRGGPCPESFHIGVLAATQPLRCDLRAGHAGDHESGGARWWPADPIPAHTPDVDYLHGVNDAITEVRRQLIALSEDGGQCTYLAAMGMLRDTAAGLGLDEDAPSGPLSAPHTAETGPTVPAPTPDPSDGSQGECDCGHEGLDPMFHLRPCPQARPVGSEIVHLIRQDYGTTGCCYRTPTELPRAERLTLHPDAVTCGLLPRTGQRLVPVDSCTCTKVGPDPACLVHQGRKPRGPKPDRIGVACICDGSGRTCPRHGAVI